MRVCVLSSGSKGNCTYVGTKNHKILIDIGTSSLYTEKSLKSINVDPSNIDIVLITHAHIDHVRGLRVFNKKYKPKIFITDKIIKEADLGDVEFNKINDLELIEDIKISSINLSHDVTDIKGYIVEEEKSSMVYITDTGYIQEKNFEVLKNKCIYIFESNHDVETLMNNPNYPHHTKIRILSDKGHLSNKDSAYYLSNFIGKNTKYIVLSHLSEQNNTEDLAVNTLIQVLNKKSINKPNIVVGKQNIMTDIYNI